MEVYSVAISKPITIDWDSDMGFGRFTFYPEDGEIVCDNEHMSRDAVKAVLKKLLADSVFTDGSK